MKLIIKLVIFLAITSLVIVFVAISVFHIPKLDNFDSVIPPPREPYAAYVTVTLVEENSYSPISGSVEEKVKLTIPSAELFNMTYGFFYGVDVGYHVAVLQYGDTSSRTYFYVEYGDYYRIPVFVRFANGTFQKAYFADKGK